MSPLQPTLPAAERLAIEDLYARYNWALDTGDVEGFADAFVPDCRVVTRLYGGRAYTYEGRQGAIDLAETLRLWSRFPGCQHYDGQLRLTPDTLAGRPACRVRSFTFMSDCRSEPPYPIRFAGHTEDTLVQVDGEWLFQERLIALWEGEVLSRFAAPST